MTLQNLLGLSLEAIAPDAIGVSRLIEAAKQSLEDASLSELSAEGRFDMAYKAIMQSANAITQAARLILPAESWLGANKPAWFLTDQ